VFKVSAQSDHFWPRRKLLVVKAGAPLLDALLITTY